MGVAMKIKIQKQNMVKILAVEPHPTHDVHVWDTDLSGFGVAISKNGNRSYVLQYRTREGRSRRMTLAKVANITPAKARELAAKGLQDIATGDDPIELRRATRRREKTLTVSALADRYLEEHAEIHKKPMSVAEDRRMIQTYVKPKLGNLEVDRVERRHVRKLHTDMVKSPYMANRVWALLSRMFSLAEKWGLRDEGINPCKGVDRYPEKSRVRYLSADELKRLGAALVKCEEEAEITPATALAVRLLVLTGCRSREILGLRWNQVDLDHNCLRLPDTKTGPRTVVLPAPARVLLADAPRDRDCPFVLPGHKRGKSLTTLRPGWSDITKRAGLDGLRVHDLRHAFASTAAVGRESLLIIGAMLGHTELETTKKYSHLSVEPVEAAAERTAATIASQMGLTGADAEVVNIRHHSEKQT